MIFSMFTCPLNVQEGLEHYSVLKLLTLAYVSNIGMSTNLMNPICAVGFVTFSLSMKGATGSPSSFSLSLYKERSNWDFYKRIYRKLFFLSLLLGNHFEKYLSLNEFFLNKPMYVWVVRMSTSFSDFLPRWHPTRLIFYFFTPHIKFSTNLA